MKIKIFFVTLVSIAIMFIATNYLFVNYSTREMTQQLKNSVSRATSLYKFINKAETLEKIRNAKELAKKKELHDAFDTEKWAEELKKRKEQNEDSVSKNIADTSDSVATKVQIELNIINKFHDDSDVLFITDRQGNVVSKNLDDTLKNVNFSDNILINNALLGRSDEDIFRMLGKLYKVVSVPMRRDGKIIGTFNSANIIDSEMAKSDFSILYEETNEELMRTPLYFAFIEKNHLLGSNMPPDIHEMFKKYTITANVFKKISTDTERKYAFDIHLNGKNFYANIAQHPQMSQDKHVHFIILSSIDEITAQIKSKKNSFMLLTVLLIVIALIFSIALEESFMKPITKFMEGMIEIINGNVKYRFNNDAEGLEGNLNQNANYMISVLLGEKTPEEVSSHRKGETKEE